MTALAPLPTRKAEDWRYSNIDAVARIWPVSAEDIVVGERESRSLTVINDADDDETVIRDYRVTVAPNASFHLHFLNMGGILGRISIDIRLERGAHFELRGAIIGGGDQTLEVVTTVNHAEPEATSEQIIRSVLAGRSTGSYLGKVAVARHAQKTDASQSVKAMLLDRTATANARPELEIYADDVKCAHGATVGELDGNALFYMASRGLDPATARTLLLQSFVAGAFEGMPEDAERDRLERAALARLEALA